MIISIKFQYCYDYNIQIHYYPYILHTDFIVSLITKKIKNKIDYEIKISIIYFIMVIINLNWFENLNEI